MQFLVKCVSNNCNAQRISYHSVSKCVFVYKVAVYQRVASCWFSNVER